MGRILREPLLYFLLIGIGFFAIYSYLNRDVIDTDPQTIVVDREKLLTYMQYRAKAFDAKRFAQSLDTLPQEQLDKLVKAYVREEALYREAKAMQLDKNDYVAKLRLIQQLEFITRGFMDVAGVDIKEGEIEAYYQQHKDNYRVAPKYTFTHVFFNRDQRGHKAAKSSAEKTLVNLNRNRVRFDQAPGYGDRFYYHLNYVKKEPEEIASHFGKEMLQGIVALKPSDTLWQGPLESQYGYHLVMLTKKYRGYIPELTEIRTRLEDDVRREKEEERFNTAIQSIVNVYKVKTETLRRSDTLELSSLAPRGATGPEDLNRLGQGR